MNITFKMKLLQATVYESVYEAAVNVMKLFSS